MADGSLVLTVLSCDERHREVTCRVENDAAIGERKNMNLPGVKVDLPTFTDQDVKDIVDFGIKRGVEFIAASFVRTGQDVCNLKKLLADNNGSHIRVISKIENQEGLENFDEVRDTHTTIYTTSYAFLDQSFIVMAYQFLTAFILSCSSLITTTDPQGNGRCHGCPW